MPLVYWGSPYPDRLPIGTEDSLQTFDPAALRRFYDDWYRPDLMAVIAVGDFDPDQVQAMIEARFGGIEAAEHPRERVRMEIPDHDDVKRVVVADPEVSRANVQILAKRDWPQLDTHRYYRDGLLMQVAFSAVNERLQELARQPEAPWLGASAGMTRLNPDEGAYAAFAAVPDAGTLQGYEALLTEIERVRRHGFRPGELERAKARVLNAYDQMAAEAEKTDSVTHATEIVRVFLTHEPMPGIAYENELAHRYVPELTVDELNTWADDWMRDRSRVVTVIMPAREGLAVPTDTDLAEIEARVAAADIPAPPEEAETGDILAALPEPGPVQATDEQYVDGLQFTGWTLANGVHVWFRETDFKQDEVRMRAFAPGGLATASEEDYVSASLAPEVVHRSGFGELDADGLSRWLAGHTVSVSHGLNENVRVASASTAPADLERTLQLVHAGFTAPRLDERGLELTRKQHVEQLRNREQDPNTAFYDAYTALLWPDDPRRQPWTVDTLDALSLERATAAWDRWMTDATGWTFVFVGNLPDDFQPLVERYLGSLPTGGEGFAVADRGVRPKAGQLEQTVRKGLDPKARVRLEYHGDFADNTFQRRNWLQGMGDVLAVLLREDLREERGGVYGVSVQTNAWIEPWSNYQVSIQFMCDPARVDELVAATTDIVAAFRTEGPAPEHVARVREQNRRSHQEDVRSNDFWLSAFAWALQYGQDPKEILAWDQRNDGLTADSVRAMAKELLVDQNRVKVVLMPAEATAQGEGAEGAEEHPQAH